MRKITLPSMARTFATACKMQEEQIFKGLKLKYLREKENNYGSNQLFELLNSEVLSELMSLKDDDIMLPFWEYEEKWYLKINDHKINEHQRKKLQENMLYIMDLTFKPYDFQKDDKRVVGVSINKINKIY